MLSSWSLAVHQGHVPGNGYQLLRYRQHVAGPRHDEILEGKAYHSQETGMLSSLCLRLLLWVEVELFCINTMSRSVHHVPNSNLCIFLGCPGWVHRASEAAGPGEADRPRLLAVDPVRAPPVPRELLSFSPRRLVGVALPAFNAGQVTAQGLF